LPASGQHQVDHQPDDRMRCPREQLHLAKDRIDSTQRPHDLDGMLAVPLVARRADLSEMKVTDTHALMIAQLIGVVQPRQRRVRSAYVLYA
jgi:hypothetical protein